MFSDDDAAAMYDILNPWGPGRPREEGFYLPLIMAAESVLDVGCGTGAMLRVARERGHRGRLTGLDPDRAALRRARARADVTWVEGIAADAERGAGHDLVTMTGHAFQDLVTDEDVRGSLAAIHAALRPGGRFAFETRHPQARAWETWTRTNPADEVAFSDGNGRDLRYWHEVDSVDGDVVAFHGTVAAPDGRVLRVLTETVRFLDVPALNALLAAAGFTIEGQYGDWERGPITASSREIITVARRAGRADTAERARTIVG
ncbi:Ubiquinone/menaquinone biosynthesis C-methylase UbiE [Actinacidiphila yanglinensis]|uniref:Ubiquinone/menaquinone biosynthesis C-methylase UbiE n=1 Tax=Actinacidiphila yanglinensis TaxID=310779 RepID=A0A1H6CU59_9ACTN|nr:class I SAM-dependent methyltransferase [Actinacidiphila yanglinensis]SEG76388.1 Ubiquinone/menaquinone biosynthesis C-methylase UbiE [Actinacidiphila yanglinensis]